MSAQKTPQDPDAAPRVVETHGSTQIEAEDPMIQHGAGPARPRRVRRDIWRKS